MRTERILAALTLFLVIVVVIGISLFAFHKDVFGHPMGLAIQYTNVNGVPQDIDSVRVYRFPFDDWATSVDNFLLDSIDVGLQTKLVDTDLDSIGVWLVKYHLYAGGETDSSQVIETIVFGLDAVAETVYVHAPHDDNWASTGTGGESSTPIYMFAVDTTNDVRIDGVTITMYKAGSSLGNATTEDDTARFNGQSGSDYTFEAFSSPGYRWETGKSVSCAAPNTTDSIMAYEFAPTASPSSNEQTTLYGWIWGPDGDTLDYAKIAVTYNGTNMYTTSVTVVPKVVRISCDENGYFEKTIYGTDSTFNWNSVTIKISHPRLDTPIKYEDITIPANGSTTRLRSLFTQSGS